MNKLRITRQKHTRDNQLYVKRCTIINWREGGAEAGWGGQNAIVEAILFIPSLLLENDGLYLALVLALRCTSRSPTLNAACVFPKNVCVACIVEHLNSIICWFPSGDHLSKLERYRED